MGFREKKFVVFFMTFTFFRIAFVALNSTGIARERVISFVCCFRCLSVEVIKCLDDGGGGVPAATELLSALMV